GGKAVRRLAGLPGNRRATAVAALVFRPEADAGRVGEFLEQQFGLRQAELLALIEADRAFQRQQQSRRLAPQRHRAFAVGGPAGDVAIDVMVGKAPARPAVLAGLEELLDAAAKMRGGEV